ncbi:mycofactocin-coupled SDR family oxidoreductase [Rhodococcus sp. T2V]|uniref:mycofactocin-coupled SDR family oxidoreductase n=1 Tax=Rhodococcus sp. T2V TaxID=3034164 RepID=UPI0023E21CE0|nr:mycofactocin-coupled SDR family oxidoreductase [Rhodococcus sp. T2V]MDF3309671.1 mycofactocin-coupled SDR family oxidoreductase [Rhodococcus sp. T2V]
MPGRVEGKVAFITGVARGQGRSHAVRLAEEGADIIGIDVLDDMPTVPYGGGTAADLEETARLVEATGRRFIASKADVRDYAQIKDAVDVGVAELGRLDIVVANAGILSRPMMLTEMDEEEWGITIDVNLSGVYRTCRAAIPHIVDGERGGSIVITSSSAGLKGFPRYAQYTAAKHGLVGLMKSLALQLAEKSIRVNTLHPLNVSTPMIHNDELYRHFVPDVPNPTREQFAAAASHMAALPISWVEPEDVSNLVVFLASEEGRFITGVSMPIDGGQVIK